MRCEVSDDTFKQYHTEQDFQKALSNQGFIRTTEDKVSKSVVKRYQNSVQWCNENEVDIEQAGIGWTEGLFRYKWNEIDGIVVNPENTQSCLQGAAFSVLVEQNTGTRCNFYTWDKEKANFVAVSRDTIAEVISSSKHQLKELYKQYVTCQDKLQTQQYI